MALRSIEITLPEGKKEQIEELLSERKEALDVRMQHIIGVWKHPVKGVMYSRLSEEQILVKILVFAEESESLLKSLQERFSDEDGFRINIIPVEASLPAEEMAVKSTDAADLSGDKENKSFRLSREELYEDISTATKLTRVYVVLVILSAIVAAIGLWNNSVAIIIGAMVIAPLLGPNVALSLAAALGDINLAKNAFKDKCGWSGHCRRPFRLCPLYWPGRRKNRPGERLSRTCPHVQPESDADLLCHRHRPFPPPDRPWSGDGPLHRGRHLFLRNSPGRNQIGRAHV